MSAPSGSDLIQFVGASGNEDASVAQSLVAAATAWVENETGLTFTYGANHVTYEDGGGGNRAYDSEGASYLTGGRRFFLLENSAAVTEVATRIPGGEWVVAAGTDWEQLGKRLLRTDGQPWPAGEDNIRITWTGGYNAAAPMPDDLRQAILDLAATWYRNRRTVTPTITEAGNLQLPVRIPSTVRAIVNNYRQVHGF